MVVLFRKHVGGIGTWRIWNEGPVLYIAHATCEGGSEVVHMETVTTNQSGRSLQEQIQLRIKSRISRMLDKGYKYTRDEALSAQTNQLGLVRPMLAQPISKVSDINYAGAVLQKKLDGHRCLITCQEGELIAYSRQGKQITSISHILEPLRGRIPEGETLDGELYHHGTPLQTIGSWIKRKQPDTDKLWYVVYDMVSSEPFQSRRSELADILNPVCNQSIKMLPGIDYKDSDHLWTYFHESRRHGFEGLILRTNDCGYQDGVRSRSLIKIKEFHDCEVIVTGFEESKEGWAVCVCQYDGRVFKVSAPGTKDQKREVLLNPDKYLGRSLTIEYSMLTIDGVPFHPNAIRWREDI